MSRNALTITIVGGLSIIIFLQLISLGLPDGAATAQAQDANRLALVDDPDNPPPAGDPKLMAIGTLGASHLYTIYGYIGVMADGYVGVTVDGENHRVYTTERISELTPEITDMCDRCRVRLEALRGELNDEDLAVANHMIEIYDLLSRQARALERFAKSGTQEDAEEFEEIRTTVWPEIATLLHIEE